MNRTVTFMLLALILGVAMGAQEEQKKKPQRVRRGLINVQKQTKPQGKFQLMSNEFGEGDMRDLQEEDLRFLDDHLSMSMSMPMTRKGSKGRRTRN